MEVIPLEEIMEELINQFAWNHCPFQECPNPSKMYITITWYKAAPLYGRCPYCGFNYGMIVSWNFTHSCLICKQKKDNTFQANANMVSLKCLFKGQVVMFVYVKTLQCRQCTINYRKHLQENYNPEIHQLYQQLPKIKLWNKVFNV